MRLGGRAAGLALALLLCLTGGLSLLPSASAATRGAPLTERSTLELPRPAGPFPDPILRGARARRLNRLHYSSAETEGVYPVVGGEHVLIYSNSYGNPQMQDIANVLGGLVHGQEMNALTVYVASPSELPGICGQEAIGCYAPSIDEMIVSGLDGSVDGIPRDFTIAHEYGHHIANNRLNPPWTALDTGAKRWATYERVCQATNQGKLFPGDEGSHYWDNPGEGFAESNAHLNFPGLSVPWGYSPLLQPTQSSLAALQADITDPWTGPTTLTWNGSFWPGRRGPAEHAFSTPLDGQVDISLSGPSGSNYDLYLLGSKLRKERRMKRRHRRVRLRRRVVERSVTAGSTEQLDLTQCGQSSIRVEVRRRSGSGPFTVSVTRP